MSSFYALTSVLQSWYCYSTTRTGYIKVTTTTGNAEFLGYLAINSNTGLFKVSQSDGVLVKIPYNPAANVWRANIETIVGYFSFYGLVRELMISCRMATRSIHSLEVFKVL